jgi:hypothetical protein
VPYALFLPALEIQHDIQDRDGSFFQQQKPLPTTAGLL